MKILYLLNMLFFLDSSIEKKIICRIHWMLTFVFVVSILHGPQKIVDILPSLTQFFINILLQEFTNVPTETIPWQKLFNQLNLIIQHATSPTYLGGSGDLTQDDFYFSLACNFQ